MGKNLGVAVVGAGIGGLAAALALIRRGYDVKV
ncbi:MAG: NAD(P)-binding protein, partial [Bradyrhizobium sp.]